MRRAFVLLLWAAAAHAEPASLAVRVPPAGRSVFLSTLQSLRTPVLSGAPLLAAAPDRTAKSGLGAALFSAPGPAPSHPLADWCVVRFADAAARDLAAARLAQALPGAAMEPVRSLVLCSARPRQTAGETPPNILQVRAPEALAAVTPDSSLIVAVIDTGSDLTHPDLAARLWHNDDPPGDADLADDATDQNGDGLVEQWERDDDDDNGYVDDAVGFDFTDAPGKAAAGDAVDRDADPGDEQGHGTHVAGILCADGSLRGVAPFVRLMTVRAAYTTPLGGGVLETDDAAAAIVYAADNGARILNLSWGDVEESRLVRDAVEYALSRGVIVVAAAGNNGRDTPHFPSSQPGVVAVGAVDATGTRSAFSNFGAGLTLSAPGEISSTFGGGILSLAPGGGQTRLRGTSMAAPHVAGIAAILLSRADRPDADGVRALLVAGAHRDGADWSRETGHGVADALASVQARADLFLSLEGPAVRFADGRVSVQGTALGGDLARWRLDLEGAAGTRVELTPWNATRVLHGVLADVAAGVADGLYEVVLRAETGAGGVHERRAALRVDRTAPVPDTLIVGSAWHGGAPHVRIASVTREPAALAVQFAPGMTARTGDAGYAARLELDVPAPAGAGPSWNVTWENPQGARRDTVVTAPPPLAPWPEGAALAPGASTTAFLPEPVTGRTPGGERVVWGRGGGTGTSGSMQAWTVRTGVWTPVFDTGLALRPVAAGDANGDGADDVLAQGFVSQEGRAAWLVSRSALGAPDSLLGWAAADRVLGLFQLDADAPLEALLSTRDSVLVFDDVRSGLPHRLQALGAPGSGGFDSFGATAAVGDLDGDGALEIAVGNAEGRVFVWEGDGAGRFALEAALDTQGTYAYELAALPAGGFLVGRQRSSDVTGDGFATAVYEFLHWRATAPGVYTLAQSWPVLAPENELRAGIAVAVSPASGDLWLALVRGGDLYLLRDQGAGFETVSHWPGAGGETPLFTDLEDNGTLDVVLQDAQGAVALHLDEGGAAPHGLASETLGGGRIRLTWQPGSITTARVRRARAEVWEVLGATNAAVWIDSTLVPGEQVQYEIEAVEGTTGRGTSNRITARAQELPHLVSGTPHGTAALRVTSSNVFGPSALDPGAWDVQADAGPPARVLQVAVLGTGREAALALDSPLGCRTFTVRARAVRDREGGRFAAGADSTVVRLVCGRPPFLVEQVRATAHGFAVHFNRALDPATAVPSRFAVAVGNAAPAVESVTPLDSASVELRLPSTVALVGRGDPWRVTAHAGLRAADHDPLVHPELEHLVRIEGPGAFSVVVSPNPVRPADAAAVFAGVSAATRVAVYTLEGELVRELSGATDGGLRWDLRTASGSRIASGIYLFVARDATGTAQGRLVVAR